MNFSSRWIYGNFERLSSLSGWPPDAWSSAMRRETTTQRERTKTTYARCSTRTEGYAANDGQRLERLLRTSVTHRVARMESLKVSPVLWSQTSAFGADRLTQASRHLPNTCLLQKNIPDAWLMLVDFTVLSSVSPPTPDAHDVISSVMTQQSSRATKHPLNIRRLQAILR